jgi:hypothetical protein
VWQATPRHGFPWYPGEDESTHRTTTYLSHGIGGIHGAVTRACTEPDAARHRLRQRRRAGANALGCHVSCRAASYLRFAFIPCTHFDANVGWCGCGAPQNPGVIGRSGEFRSSAA